MSTKSLVYDNRLDIVRDISHAIALQNSDSIEGLFDGILGMISKALNCDACGAFEASVAGIFNLIHGYKTEQIPQINNMLNSTRGIAADTMLKLQVSYTDIETSNTIYYVPIKSLQASSILMLSFKQRLNLQGIELLESIGEVLSSAVDKIMLRQKLRQQYLSTVKSLVIAIEAKDVYTQGHSQRVANYSKSIGKYLKLKDEEIDELEITGLVHDIGKIGISDSLLTKPNRLTELEFDSIKQHPEIGMKILMPLGVSENVMMGTLLHHKRYDLKGYPNSMVIDKLPLVPAIIGVADAYDAMTSERTYKKTVSKGTALRELKKNRGTQFDPIIVDVMEELVKSDIV